MSGSETMLGIGLGLTYMFLTRILSHELVSDTKEWCSMVYTVNEVKLVLGKLGNNGLNPVRVGPT